MSVLSMNNRGKRRKRRDCCRITENKMAPRERFELPRFAPVVFETTAIIQPGGSIKDDEVIQAADEANIAMVFTGCRVFRHG